MAGDSKEFKNFCLTFWKEVRGINVKGTNVKRK